MEKRPDQSVGVAHESSTEDPSAPTLASKPDRVWHTLVHWNDLPNWQQDNQYIHSGYRQASYSYSRSWQSILHWHNESVNIWTHLIPATLSIPCATVLYNIVKPRYNLATLADVVVMGCFFCGAAVCLGMSASFHTLSNHSPSVARFWNQLDYAGISVLIAGSFIPSVYYGFWCHPLKQWTYWTMVRLNRIDSGSLLTSFLDMRTRHRLYHHVGSPTVQDSSVETVQGLDVCWYGDLGHFPSARRIEDVRRGRYGNADRTVLVGIAGCLVHPWSWSVRGQCLPNPQKQSDTNLNLQARIPEALYPGRFDTVGSSHQIFHVLIVLAAMSHLRGLLKAFDYRHGTMGSICR